MATVLKKPFFSPAAAERAPRASGHWSRRAGLIVGSILLGLVVLGLLAGALITRTVNRRLADLPEYSGHVGGIRVAWWRGGVIVRNLELWTRGHEDEGPIVLLDRATISVTPAALVRGKLGLRALLDGGEIVMLKTGAAQKEAKSDEEKERQKQERLAEVRRWQGTLREAFPLELTRFEIANSKIRMIDRTVEPHAEMALDRIHLVVTGLGKKAEKAGELPADAQLTGILSGHGQLTASAQADPVADQPTFAARAEIRNLALTEIKDFMHAFAKVDVTAGTFEVYIEATASNGAYEGYVKPFFRDLEFKPVRDPDQGLLKRVATGAASAMTSLLKNDENQVATKAPFKGNFADNKVDVWTTVENLLRNAFVQSLREGLEGHRPTK